MAKWFDSRKPSETLPVLPGMRNTSRVTAEQLKSFLAELGDDNHVVITTFTLFKPLCHLTPPQRLARNLKVVLDLVRDGNTGTSLVDIVTKEEHDALVNLAKAGVTKEHQLVAYSLLNIGERFQAQSTVRTAFMSARGYKDEYLRE